LGFSINSRPIPTIEQEMTTDVVQAPIRPLTREQIEKRLKN
jgi:hypothetical protein